MTHLVNLKTHYWEDTNCAVHRSILIGGEAASLTNPEKGHTGKRKKNYSELSGDALAGD